MPGVEGAELFPSEAERVEHVGIADLLEALGVRGGATAGDVGEGLPEGRPRNRDRFACRAMMAFRKCVSGFPERIVAKREVSGARPEMRSRNRVGGQDARDLLLVFIIAGGGKKDGSARGGNGWIGVCFVGARNILKSGYWRRSGGDLVDNC